VRLTGLDHRGRAVGRTRWRGEDYRVRGGRGLPGELALVEVRRRRRDQLEVRRLETLEPSPEAVPARCAHCGTCGGCTSQELAYEAQLRHKQAWVTACLEGLTLGGPPRIEPIVPCAEPFGYRNKMDFTFSNRRWIEAGEPAGVPADFALGLHVPGHRGKVLDVGECHLQFPEGNAILASARRLARAAGLSGWDVHEHRGLLRHLVLRRSHASGQILALLITRDEAPEAIEPYARALLREQPAISTLVQAVSSRLAVVAAGERERVLHGPGFITEELAGLRFRISASSFFQVNTPAAEELVAVVREEVAGSGRETLYDLYCGGGVFALSLANEVREVRGFELIAAAVEDAWRNAEANGVENARFEAGDLRQLLSASRIRGSERPSPDVVVIDPPRAGMHPAVTDGLVLMAPPRIVWVCCNLRAAHADLRRLNAIGWRLLRARPLDLFPHTPHVECVLTLERPGATPGRPGAPPGEAPGA